MHILISNDLPYTINNLIQTTFRKYCRFYESNISIKCFSPSLNIPYYSRMHQRIETLQRISIIEYNLREFLPVYNSPIHNITSK